MIPSSQTEEEAYAYDCYAVAFRGRYREVKQFSLKELLSHFPKVLDLGYVEKEKKQVAMLIIAQKARGLSIKQINFFAPCMGGVYGR